MGFREKNNDRAGGAATGTAVSKTADNEVTDKLGEAFTGDKEAAQQVLSKAKDKAGEMAGRAYGEVRDQAETKVSEQKSQLARELSAVAENLKQVDDNLHNVEQETPIVGMTGKYTGSLARQIERTAHYLDTREVGEMVSDLEDFARRNPAVFIGGAFAAGLLLARFLKSSGTRHRSGTKHRTADSRTGKSGETGSSFSGQQGVTGIDRSGG